MTCYEYWSFAGKKLEDCTRAERIARRKHFNECHQCREETTVLARIGRNAMTAEELAESQASVQKLARDDVWSLDPEAR